MRPCRKPASAAGSQCKCTKEFQPVCASVPPAAGDSVPMNVTYGNMCQVPLAVLLALYSREFPTVTLREWRLPVTRLPVCMMHGTLLSAPHFFHNRPGSADSACEPPCILLLHTSCCGLLHRCNLLVRGRTSPCYCHATARAGTM